MYYFDSKFLQQYIDQKIDLKVFTNGKWYSITSLNDLSDDINGIGYDEYGSDFRFDYRQIEKIQVGSNILTLDQLQTQMTGKEPEKEKPKPKEKEPEVSHYNPFIIGRSIFKKGRKVL